MNTIAIICEYNPLHMGHIYQINEIKKSFPQSRIIALMSGSFVQRGTPSILNKFDKAKFAIENGIDLVLELPTIISLQSADFFSHYAVKILDELRIVNYISFGIESESANDFYKFIKEEKSKADIINTYISSFIKEGFSYKRAYIKAISQIFSEEYDFLSLANNTLALQYIKALNKLKSNIKVHAIKRKGLNYHDLKQVEGQNPSASAIRNLLKENKSIKNLVPENIEKYLNKNILYSIDDYSDIFYYNNKVINKNPADIAGFENGIDNLISKNFSGTLSHTIEKSANKRYSKARLQRFILNYILDIKKDQVKNLDKLNYIRPLAFNNVGADILRDIKNNSSINIINSLMKTDNLSTYDKIILEIEKSAYRLKNLNYPDFLKLDFINNPYIA